MDAVRLQERIRIQGSNFNRQVRFSEDDSHIYVIEQTGIVEYSTLAKDPGTLIVKGTILAFKVSNDGHWLSYLNLDGNCFLYNISTHDTRMLPPTREAATDFEFDSTSTVFAVVAANTISLFKFGNDSLTSLTPIQIPSPGTMITFDSNGNLLVIAGTGAESQTPDINLYRISLDPQSPAQLPHIETHTIHTDFPLTQIMFRDNGKVLVLLGRYEQDWKNSFTVSPNDPRISILTPPTADWSGRGGFLAKPATSDVSSDGTKYLTANDHEFAFYDLGKQTKRADFAGPITAVERVAVSRGHFLFAEYQNSPSAIWDLHKGTRLFTIQGTANLGSQGTLAYVGQKHMLYLLDLNSDSDESKSTDLQISGDSTGLRVSDSTQNVVWLETPSLAKSPLLKVWNWKAGGKPITICESANWFSHLEISPSGGRLAATCNSHGDAYPHVYVWDLLSLTKKDLGKCDSNVGLAFSYDGKYLAIAGGKITIADIEASRSFSFAELPGFLTPINADGSVDLGSAGSYQNEYSSISFSPDGTSLIVGISNLFTGEGSVEKWTNWNTDAPSHEHLVDHIAPVATVQATDKYFFVGSVDGGTRLFEWNSQTPIATLISIPGSGWAVVAPDGLFDGAADAIEWIGWRASELLPLTTADVFFEEFYHPGLFGEIMSGENPKASGSRSIGDLLNLPGLDSLLAARLASFKVIDQNFRLCLPSEPSQDLIDHLSVYRNGDPSPLNPSDFELRSDPDCNYFKKLPGELRNYQLTSTAISLPKPRKKAAVLSQPGRVDLSKSSIYFQSVAFKEYKHIDKLKFSVSDGKSLHDFFQAQAFPLEKDGGPHWAEETPLGDGNSVAQIRKRLREIGSASKPQDIVILFFSGHGSVPPGQEMFYFLPDYTEGESPDQVREAGLNTAMFADAIRAMNARRVVLILDSCQSGGVLDSLSRAANSLIHLDTATGGEAAGVPKIPRTIAIIAAATPFQLAVEQGNDTNTRSGSGILTRAFLEILKTEDIYTVRELVDRLPSRMNQIIQENPHGRSQDPELVVVGGDVPLRLKAKGSRTEVEEEKK